MELVGWKFDFPKNQNFPPMLPRCHFLGCKYASANHINTFCMLFQQLLAQYGNFKDVFLFSPSLG